jgi:hypothetical protein
MSDVTDREWIVDLIQKEFDKAPIRPLDWDEGADGITTKIIARLTAREAEVRADERKRLAAGQDVDALAKELAHQLCDLDCDAQTDWEKKAWRTAASTCAAKMGASAEATRLEALQMVESDEEPQIAELRAQKPHLSERDLQAMQILDVAVTRATKESIASRLCSLAAVTQLTPPRAEDEPRETAAK